MQTKECKKITYSLQKAAKLQQVIDAKEIGRLESEIKKLEDLNTR